MPYKIQMPEKTPSFKRQLGEHYLWHLPCPSQRAVQCYNSPVQLNSTLSAERKSLTAAEIKSEILVTISDQHLKSRLHLLIIFSAASTSRLYWTSSLDVHYRENSHWQTGTSLVLANSSYYKWQFLTETLHIFQIITKTYILMVCANFIVISKIHFLTSLPYFFHTDIYITAVYSLHFYFILQRCHNLHHQLRCKLILLLTATGCHQWLGESFLPSQNFLSKKPPQPQATNT